MIKPLRALNKHILKSNESNKTILYNTVGALLVKGGAIIISLFTIPAYLSYFNNQQILGLWFTILSVLSWILTFDLGIGNGLRNHLVAVFAQKDDLAAKKYISSAYIIIGVMVLLSILISIIVFRFIDLNLVFNIPIDVVSKKTLYFSVNIVFSGIMFQFFFKLITSILYAMQKSALNNLLSLLTSIITLVYVLSSKSTNVSSNLISLAIVNVLAVNIPLLLTTIIVFSKKLKNSKPSFYFFERKYAEEVMKLGGVFFWVQIMYMIITTTNEFLITRLSGSQMVVEYQIYNKLFTLIGVIFTLAITPIWSAVTKAFTEQNYNWIKKLYKILNIMALIAVFCEFTMIPFLQFGINIWLGDSAIQVNHVYAIIFAISGSVFIWNSVLSSIANGIGELKTQAIFFTIGAIIKIPISWILVDVLNSWIGVVIANIIAMSMYCVIQPIWLCRFFKNRKKGVVDNV